MKLLPNTYEGLVWGLRNFDGIETDLRLTSDNQLVLFHDLGTESGTMISEMTLQEAVDLGIPSFKKFLAISEVIELSKTKRLYFELKPDCLGKQPVTTYIADSMYKAFQEVVTTSSIDVSSIVLISFVKELLHPFSPEYPCVPIVPEINECNFSIIRALPKLLTKSLHWHLKDAKKQGFAGVFFARSYLHKLVSFRHPSYRKFVKLAKKYDLIVGTNTTDKLELKYDEIERFTDDVTPYPRKAEAGKGLIIARRGTGAGGTEVPEEDVPTISFHEAEPSDDDSMESQEDNNAADEGERKDNTTFNAEILEITDESENIKTFKMTKPASFEFNPGQYCWLSIPGFERSPMAIASSPKDAWLEFTVRLWGAFTQKLFTKSVGDEVIVDGPHGTYFPLYSLNSNAPLYLIAGGTGITPIRSVVTSLGQNVDKQVFYGAKSPENLLYLEEIHEWPASVTLTVDTSNEQWAGFVGLVTEVLDHTELDKNGIAFVCGPRQMEKAVVDLLKIKGLSEDNIFVSVEKFDKSGNVVGPVLSVTDPQVPF